LNLQKLHVSLTKHGAHKIALLLRDEAPDQVLDHVGGSHAGVNIDRGQAEKNLSATKGRVPALWNTVRNLGQEAINGLVLIAIIFSHHELIRAMAEGHTGSFRGVVVRGRVIDGKAYTNFAHTLERFA